MRWLRWGAKTVKLFVKTPGWLKGPLVLALLVVVLLGLLLAPVLGILVVVLLVVGGLLALLLSPLRALAHRIK